MRAVTIVTQKLQEKHQKLTATTRVLQHLGDKKYSEFKALYIQ